MAKAKKISGKILTTGWDTLFQTILTNFAFYENLLMRQPKKEKSVVLKQQPLVTQAVIHESNMKETHFLQNIYNYNMHS